MKLESKIAWQILEQLANNKLLSVIEPKYDSKDIKIPFYQAIFQLVECGCLEYTKLCYENYYYWWCEMPKEQKRFGKKNIFTCNVDDFKITNKAIHLIKLRDMDYFIEQKKYWNFYQFLQQYDLMTSNLLSEQELIEIITYQAPKKELFDIGKF